MHSGAEHRNESEMTSTKVLQVKYNIAETRAIEKCGYYSARLEYILNGKQFRRSSGIARAESLGRILKGTIFKGFP